jgi:DNA-binding CsgD family transcriptional regulator
MRRHRWTREKLLEVRKQATNSKDLAKIIGCSYCNVVFLFMRYNIPPYDPNRTRQRKYDLKKLQALWEKYTSYEEIAKELEISVNTVMWIKAHYKLPDRYTIKLQKIDEKYIEILRELNSGKDQAQIAKERGVSKQAINFVINRHATKKTSLYWHPTLLPLSDALVDILVKEKAKKLTMENG